MLHQQNKVPSYMSNIGMSNTLEILSQGRKTCLCCLKVKKSRVEIGVTLLIHSKNYMKMVSPSILKTSQFSMLQVRQRVNLRILGSMSVSKKLHTYPFPNSTLALTCYQSTVVGLREGKMCSCILALIRILWH